jgi:ribonuclease HI
MLRRHERESAEVAHGTRRQRAEFARCLFRRAANPRNLRCAIDHLVIHGGQAPGPNGLRLADLDNHACWSLARVLSKALLAGTYRPSKELIRNKPKGPHRGTRPIVLQDAQDRVIQRAILQVIQPMLEPLFARDSYGSRPHRDRWQALARAEAVARQHGAYVWVLADLRDAFEQVPIGRLLDVVRRHLPADDLLQLIETVIRRPDRHKGLRQGGNLSPAMMNVYLDQFLDRPWHRQHPHLPLIRVVDDLLILCRTAEEAQQAYAELHRLLAPAGMPLKNTGSPPITDLTREDAGWLGYLLRWRNQRIEAHLTPACWDGLHKSLAEPHGQPHPEQRATMAILEWVAQLGPCYPHADVEEVYAGIRQRAEEQSYYEPPSYRRVRSYWQRAYARWAKLRNRICNDTPTPVATGGSATPHGCLTAGQHGGAPAMGAPSSFFKLWTDGACLGARGPGGWAYILLQDGAEHETVCSGGSAATTNNRMELLAVLRALETLPAPSAVRLITDSTYVSRGINEWLPGWKAAGWRAGQGRRKRAVKNRELWERLDAQLDRHQVTAEWVPGHAGNTRNEQCDRLAKEAAQQAAATLVNSGQRK